MLSPKTLFGSTTNQLCLNSFEKTQKKKKKKDRQKEILYLEVL